MFDEDVTIMNEVTPNPGVSFGSFTPDQDRTGKHFKSMKRGRSKETDPNGGSNFQFNQGGVAYGDYDGTPLTTPAGVTPWLEAGQVSSSMVPGPSTAMAAMMTHGWSGAGVQRQPVTFSLCVMYPPHPSSQPPTLRDRPPGCKTVFIGGLPGNVTEEVILDVFSSCGEIQSFRPSKKNFCHIRFMSESSVDMAIAFCGWRMKIGNSSEAENSGKLHVDFAQARDDQYDWECEQRRAEREARQMSRLVEDMARPPSPPPVPHFSDLEAAAVAEQIRSEAGGGGEDCGQEAGDPWARAAEVLLTWLERGDCSKKNSHSFYSMIQALSGHGKRLSADKNNCDQELEILKRKFMVRKDKIQNRFAIIERVLAAASHQKVWDHLSKPQRKSVTSWKQQLQDVKVKMQASDNMDIEEEDEHIHKKSKKDSEEENNLDERDFTAELEEKDRRISMLQTTLQGMQKKLLEAQKKNGTLPDFLDRGKDKQPVVKVQENKEVGFIDLASEEEDITDSLEVNQCNKDLTTEEKQSDEMQVFVKPHKSDDPPTLERDLLGKVDENNSDNPQGSLHDWRLEARVVMLISLFLNIHPHGATSSDIFKYVDGVDEKLDLNCDQMENILRKYPNCFSSSELISDSSLVKWKIV